MLVKINQFAKDSGFSRHRLLKMLEDGYITGIAKIGKFWMVNDSVCTASLESHHKRQQAVYLHTGTMVDQLLSEITGSD